MGYGYNVQSNSLRNHLIRYGGKGPELLLIPGVTSPAITWGFAAERRAEAFDVHVLDVRGWGLSETGDLDNTLDSMAADAVALAEQMDRPIVMGHSMGAHRDPGRGDEARDVQRRHSGRPTGLRPEPPPLPFSMAVVWRPDQDGSQRQFCRGHDSLLPDNDRTPARASGRMAAHLPLWRNPHLL